jgi:hypothetical protein
MLDEQHKGLVGEERKEYIEACRKGDDDRAQAALNRSGLKDAAYFLHWHRKALEAAYMGNTSNALDGNTVG